MGKQYAVLRIHKHKKNLGRIGTHIDRKSIQGNVDSSRTINNEDLLVKEILGEGIDESRIHLNEHHIKNGNLTDDVKARIEEGRTNTKRGIRKDATYGVEVLLMGSHDRMKEIEKDEVLFEKWKRANYNFAVEEFGKDNIVRFTLHLDEKTPHIHCVFVPITKDGRLSADHYFPNKYAMRSLQDRYAVSMKQFGLERGIEKELTNAKNIPMREYYRGVNEAHRAAQEKTKEVRIGNALNLSGVREDLSEELTRAYTGRSDAERAKDSIEKTYSSFVERSIKSDIERVKKEVNLIKHLHSMGYSIDKDKSCKTYVVMLKEGDKLLLPSAPNKNGHWVYKSLVDDKDRGTIVDLMLNRGYSYRDIRGLSSAHLEHASYNEYKRDAKEYTTDPELQSQLAKDRLKSVKQQPENNYFHGRGIKTKTYQNMKGFVVGKEAVFALYRDVNSHGKGRICSTIAYKVGADGKHVKYFQKGLPRGICILRESDDIRRVVITESPIDALSHKQLIKEDKHTMYLCTCGSITKDIRENIEQVAKEVKMRTSCKVVLAMDNDVAGKKMHSTIAKVFEKEGVPYAIHPPNVGKDWNDTLMSSLGDGLKVAQSVQSALAQAAHGEREPGVRRKRRKLER